METNTIKSQIRTLNCLRQYKVVLGSNSPRRRELLAGLDIDFEVRTISGIDESYPATMAAKDIPVFLAKKKAEAYLATMPEDELLITADTIVWTFDEILGKPKDREEAIAMLRKLSGCEHEVITGVCLTYVDKYRPFDKAGSYGIQEWIGYVAVESINGSFYNVMGLPVRLLYKELKQF